MRFPSAAVLTILLATSITAESNFSDFELETMEAFSWCNGGANLIHWIDKSEDAWQAKVMEGVRFAPERNAESKIDNLDAFVLDRLETIPLEVANEALPALIIENYCASVENSTADCIFDFAGTPAPEQWALQDGIGGILPSFETSVPAEISFWEREDEMTVVYVPSSDSEANAEELTSNNPNEPELASLKVRGNSSRKIAKKQFQLKLPSSMALIPQGIEAKKWIISAYPSDYTYVENSVVFDSYQRIGDLQKQYSADWPSEGSIEDLATLAWSPRSQPVNLILQGRYVGVYNIVDKVDDDRVWIPESNNETNTQPMVIDGMTPPSGSYILEFDWSERQKKVLNPDREISGEENEFYLPNHPAGASDLYNSSLGFDNIHGWTIAGPDDKTFADSENDEDVALLQSLLLKVDEWLEDPVANDDLISQVVDMRSFARYFLMAEIAREADEYCGSMIFKFVQGKLYHAAPWDYAGTSYPTDSCGSNLRWNGVRVAWETGTYDEPEPCDASTGGMYTAGWHVDSLYLTDFLVCTSCENGEPVQSHLRWFFSQLFHTPNLQTEFWALWDIVAEHGMVESESSTMADSGDLFSTNMLIDQRFEPQRVAASVDRTIWYAQMALIYFAAEITASGQIPEVDTEVCTPIILYESLQASAPGDNVTEPHGKNWKFHTAAESGEFMQFYRGQDLLASYFADIIDNDALIAKKKEFIAYRLNWIASQHPTQLTTESPPAQSQSPSSGVMASNEYSMFAIFVRGAFTIGMGWFFCF